MEASLDLAAYAATSLLSAALWLAYAPAAKAVEDRFGWSPAQVAALGLWPPVVAVLGAPLTPRVVERLGGARAATTCASLLVAAAAGVRVVPGSPALRLGLAHAGGLLNAFAGVLVLSVPAIVARHAVAPRWRTAATSCLLAANNLGAALGFVVAAAVADVETLLRLEFLVAFLSFALFAPRHRLFPRRVATSDDEPLLPADAAKPCLCGPLATARSYLFLAWGYGLAAGSFTGWQGVLSPLLEQRGWPPRRCDWVGVASGGAMAVAQVLAGFASTSRERLVVVASAAGAFAACAGLAVSVEAGAADVAAAAAAAGGFLVVAPEGVVYELATRRLPPSLHAAAGAGLVWCFNVPMGCFVALAALGAAPLALTWGLAFAVLAGLFLVSVEAIARHDYPYPFSDPRPRSADDEMRPRGSETPSIAAPAPPAPPPVETCKVRPCGAGFV